MLEKKRKRRKGNKIRGLMAAKGCLPGVEPSGQRLWDDDDERMSIVETPIHSCNRIATPVFPIPLPY